MHRDRAHEVWGPGGLGVSCWLLVQHERKKHKKNWVAVKELKLSYYIGETLLFAIYTPYGNLI